MSTIAVKKVKLGDNADTSKNFLIEVPAVSDGTLTIKREDGTAVLSIDANGKAVIPGVVGTVAQVGGIPTGQIVERGSNANGEYVRFADGTQICTSPLLPVNDTSAPHIRRTVWTFPSSFPALPACTGNYAIAIGTGAREKVATVSGPVSITQGFVAVASNSIDLTPYTNPGDASLIAIGRWF